jgi:transcription elongation factor Elf1
VEISDEWAGSLYSDICNLSCTRQEYDRYADTFKCLFCGREVTVKSGDQIKHSPSCVAVKFIEAYKRGDR